MGDVASDSPALATSQNQLLRRRNSISTAVVVPINLSTLHHESSNSHFLSSTSASTTTSSSSSSSGDVQHISIKPISYISLKDLLPSTPVNSPKPNSTAQTGSDISIKNRLVKQAAWAYLQPMSTSPESSARNFLHRLWHKFELLKNPVADAFRGFFHLHIFRRLNHAFDWLLRAIRIRSFS